MANSPNVNDEEINTPDRPTLPQGRIIYLTKPFLRFQRIQSASGVLLVICAAVSLILANLPGPISEAFLSFWETTLRIGIGPFILEKSLHWWVNDGLMTLFFFVVGLEIKRELVCGELSTVPKASLPAIAALGGMIVPAGLYLMLQWGEPSRSGWGIPMATDIAFVVGILALFGKRVPAGLKIFLLALAIVDDLGAILVIAIVYTEQLSLIALGWALAGLLVMLGMRLLGVRSIAVYFVVGIATWLATYLSGIHPTIAGVAIGLLTPSMPLIDRTKLWLSIDDITERLDESRSPEKQFESIDYTRLRMATREAVSPLERLEHSLNPWVAFLIMPLFALVNAGVIVKMSALTDPVAWSVVLGLTIGKPVGIFLFSWLAILSGVARLPQRVTMPMLLAAGCLGGIGFTMSLFIAPLGLTDDHLPAGKIGILIGSGLSVALGSFFMLRSLKSEPVYPNQESMEQISTSAVPAQ